MKQRPDPAEKENGGPLFAPRCGCGGLCDSSHPCPMAYNAPRLSTLFSPGDPETSRRAAVKAVQSGTVKGDAELLLRLIRESPGKTLAFYGEVASACYSPSWQAAQDNAFRWRLKLGRRTGNLVSRGLVHTEGEVDAMSLWWPGPKP